MKRFIAKNKIEIIILLLFIVAFGCYSLSLGQDFNFDLLNYHFYNAYAYLHHRRLIDITPEGIQFYFSPIIDLFLYPLYLFLTPQIYAFIIGGLSGIAAFGCYQILNLILDKSDKPLFYIQLLAGISVCVTGFANLSQVGTAFGGNIVTIFVIWGLYFMLKYNKHGNTKSLIASAILLGIAPALKLTSALYVVAIVISFFCLYERFSRKFFIFTAIMIISFIVVDLPWMLEMYKELHNPIYPLLSGYLNKYTALNIEFDSDMPKTVLAWLFYPFYFFKMSKLTAEIPFRDFRLGIVYLSIFIIVASSFFAKIKKEVWFLAIFTVISYAFWLTTFSIQRYAIPLEFMSGILMVLAIQQVSIKRETKIILTLLVALIVLATTHVSDWGHIGFNKKFFQLKISHNPTKSLVILNTTPLTYLIPEFNTSNIFINQPNRSDSSRRDKDRKNALIHSFIKENKKIYLVDYDIKNMQKTAFLKRFGLTINPLKCHVINSTNQTFMCELSRNRINNRTKVSYIYMTSMKQQHPTLSPERSEIFVPPGGGIKLKVTLHNTLKQTILFFKPLHITYHLFNHKMQQILFVGERTPLNTVYLKKHYTQNATIGVPKKPGVYYVKFDLVWEGHKWFKLSGPILKLVVK